MRVTNTKNASLWRGPGDSIAQRLKNKTAWMGLLYPLMQGHKKGKINMFLIQKRPPERTDR